MEERAYPSSNRKNSALMIQRSLRDRADDVLIAIATIGLLGSMADGRTERKEIDSFLESFRKRFVLSPSSTLKVLSFSYYRISHHQHESVLQSAIDTLNEHLDQRQKTELLQQLEQMLLADSRLDPQEASFFSYVAEQLGIGASVESEQPKYVVTNPSGRVIYEVAKLVPKIKIMAGDKDSQSPVS